MSASHSPLLLPQALLTAMLMVLGAAPPARTAATESEAPSKPRFRAGTIDAQAVSESSGLVASRKREGVFWTVNDSGHDPVLYAITREGALIAEFPVDAKNTDWEDLATDDAGRLYVADVGNNARRRTEVQVLRVDEADPRAAGVDKPAPLHETTTWRLTYPGRPFDCEALIVFGGHGYLIEKRLDGAAAGVYRFELKEPPPAESTVLERVATLPVHAPVTAADISPDAKRLAVLTVLGPYVLEVGGDVSKAADAPVWYSRYVHPRMEAACFVPGGLLVTAETREIFFFGDEYFQPVERSDTP